MSILLQQKNVGDYSYMSSPNIYYRAFKNVEVGYNETHFLVVKQLKYGKYCVVIFLKYSKLLYCCTINIIERIY